MQITNRGWDRELNEINLTFPNLFKSGSLIVGELDFSARYKIANLKHNWVIERCSSGSDCIQDCYEIEIRLTEKRNGLPKVYETGNRIKNLAVKLGKPIIDLHLYPDEEDCCLGLYLPYHNLSLSEFVQNRVYPFFVWQAYFEKYNEIPPCGEYSHGKDGLEEFKAELIKTGPNNPCPCGSKKKFKKCCKPRFYNALKCNNTDNLYEILTRGSTSKFSG